MDAPQNPTDGTATQTAPEVKAPVAPAAETKAPAAPAAEVKAPEQKQPETPEKPLPGLSVEKPKPKAEPRPGAPEKYDWKIDGDPQRVEALTKTLEPMARKLGLSNDEIHGVYDTFKGIAEKGKNDVIKQWATALETDKEFGGDKLEETLALAQSVVDQYGDDDFRGLIEQSGLRHNPAVLKLLARVAKDVGGDRLPRVPDQKVKSGTGDACIPR
jgi:hypothetical protein